MTQELKVREEQTDVFPAPVVYWIAESKYVEEFELRAAYWGDDLVIGHRPNNLVAGKLYESLGFTM